MTTTLNAWDAPNAEHALVGIALHRPEVVDEVPVTGPDFHEPRCEAVWDAVGRLHAAGKPADPITVQAALPADARGITLEWLFDVHAGAPVPALAEHYAGLVADEAGRRRLAEAAVKITQAVRDGVPAAEAVQHARGWVDACQADAVGVTGYVGDHFDAFLASLEQEPDLIPTAWADLNQIIGGWRTGAMYVIGARPGVGKTMFSTQTAVDLAGHGHVAVSNLEMSRNEVLMRITAQTAGVHLGRLLDRKLTADDWSKISRHTPQIAGMPLSIDDTSGATLAHIRAHARSVSRKGHLAGVVVDYIGLIRDAGTTYRPRHEVVGEFSRALKRLAQELHVPVIVLSQLNRNAAGQRPQTHELKESGSLEQDADVVMLLHTDPEKDGTELEVTVSKNRHGPTGDLQLLRRGHLARVDNMAWQAAA